MKIKKFTFLVCSSIFLNLYASAAATADSAADNLQSLLGFETARTFAMPLMPENLGVAKEVDDSDESYVQVMDGASSESLERQAKFLTSTSGIVELGKAGLSEVHYGIFEKEKGLLVGVFKIWRVNTVCYDSDKNPYALPKSFLSTSTKFHKAHQGKGYATEFKKGLFKHYQAIGLIPDSKENSKTPYMGFSGLIHLTNRASLKYNIAKCGYRVGRLFGDRVEVYYPFVAKTGDYDFLPPEDENLHETIAKLLDGYLEGDKASEKCLREIALKNLLGCGADNLEKALNSEDIFLAATLTEFPDMFGLISAPVKDMIDRMVSKELAELEDHIKTHPDDAEKCSDYLSKSRSLIALCKK